MQKNTSIKIPKINLGYVKSSGNWRKLQNFNNRLINKYINKTEFAYDLEKVEKSMNENVCDDCLRYEEGKSKAKRYTFNLIPYYLFFSKAKALSKISSALSSSPILSFSSP